MSFLARPLSFLPCALLSVSFVATLGCHAQTPKSASAAPAGGYSSPIEPITVGKVLPLADARRVEVLLRGKANLPPGATVHISPVAASDVPGYGEISITFTAEGQNSKPLNFLISNDGKSLAQFNKFDISGDPRAALSPEGRPSRGGPATAPVVIVGFDDLECPYCALLHASIFPLIEERYGNKVHFVYKDYPLTEIHPWAMRASIDVNCLAAQSPAGYWNEVDYIHAHSREIGGDPKDPKAEKTQTRANQQLDDLVREQGKFQKVDMARLDTCLKNQDPAAIKPMQMEGEHLGLGSTPTLYINGDKVDGAVPVPFIFGIIDDALRAEGVQPPPPYTPPAAPAAAKPTVPAAPAKK